ncbi:putative alpha beta hydrolase fold protein [Rosellinia necatrix]|uniref:Putative alpha beta hydrolase fold protein n=1 Tax=Rosellinia necatrix TaxID=77044 RepID=A0A1S7UNH6_ROSNE|nr:putative alpha beta hydrolase fold protein [Rosellinia necatrix]
MLNFLHLSYSYLHWRRPSGPPAAAPDGTTRTFISTPKGDLELLCARPTGPAAAAADGAAAAPPVVVFLHGGMGSAWVWHEYMRHLAGRGVTSYAVSARGHGASWHPSFARMLFATTKRALADDFVAGIRAVQAREGGREVVLVGHSSGGGLSQLILSEGDVRVSGLALLGAVPGSGSLSVYVNWWFLDPWFTIRMMFHGLHSNSPLSHPFLVRRVFFSDDYPDEKLADFQGRMNRYESFLWPCGMVFRFADPKRVLRNITGWGTGNRVLIMAGTEEKLMTRPVQEKAAETYRAAFSGLVRDAILEAKDEAVQDLPGEGGLDNAGHGVELAYVPGAGHHLQNDTMWEIGAEKLLAFLRRL